MSDPLRLRYFMENHFGHSVITINFQEWGNLVRHDGCPTKLERVPGKLSGVMRDAEVVAIAASGISNGSPGIEIVRREPKDAPFIYNTDHYTVIERLSEHPDFVSIAKRAGVSASSGLRNTLDSWVWIVGPERDPENHWAEEIPEFIKRATPKP
jgi:hypothetical protein